MQTSFFMFIFFAQEKVTAGVADPEVLHVHGATTVDGLTPSISRPVVTLFYRGTACGEYIAAQTSFQVTIGLHRGSTLIAQRSGSYPTSSSSKTFEVLFSQGIFIRAGFRYAATAEITTSDSSHAHYDGMASTSCSGVTVTFKRSSKDSNASKPSQGQIPALMFRSSHC